MESLSKGTLTEWLNRDFRVTLGGAAIAFFFFITVLYQRSMEAEDPREPPLIPYTIPWLGSALPFSRDFDNFIQWIRKTMPADTPYRMYAGGRTIYIVNSPRLYAKFIRISKTMSFDLLERDIFTKIFPFSQADLDAYCVGMHGAPEPAGMSKEEIQELKMATKFHNQFNTNWLNQTEGLEVLRHKFAIAWEKRVNDIIGDKKESTVSLRKLMEHQFFWAAADAHFGTRLGEIDPNFTEKFWGFEDGFLKFFQDNPAWMLTKPAKARNEMVEVLEKWTTMATENAPNLSDDEIWNEWWGGRINWQRDRTTKARGLSLRARALHAIALLWALNANTAPVISWMLVYILRNPYLLPKLREEVKTAISFTPELSVDWQILTKLPLLLSIYQESMRLVVSNMTARIITEDTDLDGYILKKGRMMVAPSRALHLSPAFDHPDHPATEFWAERFILGETEKLKLLNSWRPFAGGTTYCPGRYIAGSEICFAIGIMVLKFDMTLEERDGKIERMFGREGAGGVRGDRDGYITMKKV